MIINDDEQQVIHMVLKNTNWPTMEADMGLIAKGLMVRIIKEQKEKIEKNVSEAG